MSQDRRLFVSQSEYMISPGEQYIMQKGKCVYCRHSKLSAFRHASFVIDLETLCRSKVYYSFILHSIKTVPIFILKTPLWWYFTVCCVRCGALSSWRKKSWLWRVKILFLNHTIMCLISLNIIFLLQHFLNVNSLSYYCLGRLSFHK